MRKCNVLQSLMFKTPKNIYESGLVNQTVSEDMNRNKYYSTTVCPGTEDILLVWFQIKLWASAQNWADKLLFWDVKTKSKTFIYSFVSRTGLKFTCGNIFAKHLLCTNHKQSSEFSQNDFCRIHLIQNPEVVWYIPRCISLTTSRYIW